VFLEKNFGFQNKEEVLEIAENGENRIEFINLLFPDIIGDLKGFRIPSSELKSAFEDGKGFDGSSIEGFARIEESDLVAKPDPKTFRVFPWEYENDGVKYKAGMMFCDIFSPDRKTYEGDTRYVLKRVMKEAEKKGFDSFKVGPEIEFFYVPKKFDIENPDINYLDWGGYFGMGSYDPHAELKQNTILKLKKMGIEAEFEHHEVAKSQQEIDVRFKDVIEMADTVMLAKYVIKEMAERRGIRATFMPKVFNRENGSGMHVHQSLWKGEKNVFFDENEKYYLSDTAKKYMAGVFHHINDIASVTNQWVNSYKRIIPGFEAPVYHTWGQKNRSALIRVPEYQPGKENATRIEVRNPDPACNPYLAFSLMLSTGLDGMEKEYELQSPHEENVYENNKPLKTLPGSLREALENTKKSELVRKTLGEHIFTKFIENKEKEIENYEWEVPKKYDKTVSPYELEHNLPRL